MKHVEKQHGLRAEDVCTSARALSSNPSTLLYRGEPVARHHSDEGRQLEIESSVRSPTLSAFGPTRGSDTSDKPTACDPDMSRTGPVCADAWLLGEIIQVSDELVMAVTLHLLER